MTTIATLNFTAPTIPAGGAAISAIRVERSPAANGTYSVYNDYPVGTAVTFVVPLNHDQYYRLRSVDVNGRISDFTNPVRVTFQEAPPVNPNPPGDPTVTYSFS